MAKLILLRHGQSVWNLENRFTGWVDVDLSEQGVNEARAAGTKLKDIPIQHLFTSVLSRAIRTADLALETAQQKPALIERAEALNERHYGDLQGLNKDDMRKKYGEEQVHIWRRSFDVRPPNGESLKDTCDRTIPYWREKILPTLKKGENVLITAHGNSLRALTKELEGLTDDQIIHVEIPTGTPIVYDVDASGVASNKRVLA